MGSSFDRPASLLARSWKQVRALDRPKHNQAAPKRVMLLLPSFTAPPGGLSGSRLVLGCRPWALGSGLKSFLLAIRAPGWAPVRPRACAPGNSRRALRMVATCFQRQPRFRIRSCGFGAPVQACSREPSQDAPLASWRLVCPFRV